MFSPPRGAASCPPCWKPIPVTDSGRQRSGGGGKGAEGHTARQDRRPGTLGGHGRVSRTAGGRRPPPLPPPRVGLCNPVAAARPRAGPWGEGRGRLGWGREAATRGAACTVDPRADGRVSRSRVRREARAGGRAGRRPRRA